ncbi:MAG TPA: glycosyltransferase family A protein [Chryseolinea sp.]|nr:glycosyltransferase family A protein [Chryseolinea sp.]
MMKSSIDVVVVVPIGPTCKTEFVLDTLSSVQHYIHSSHKIIIADDAQNPDQRQQIQAQFPDVIIHQNKKNLGKALGLYTSLSRAYSYALDHFNFSALLRLDSDALVIGHAPELAIIEYFKNNPTVGLAGRYAMGIRSLDEFGNVWPVGGRQNIAALVKMFTRFYSRHPITYWRIRQLVFKAIDNGYELGEMIFGGSYAFSRIGLEKLRDNGLLPMKNVVGTELDEDHVFSIMTYSVGLHLGNLAVGNLPFALTWRGLPASPQTLVDADKKIIHSTRFWKEMKETEIRQFFKDKRLAKT